MTVNEGKVGDFDIICVIKNYKHHGGYQILAKDTCICK